jgi:hypothetical protein
MLNANHRRNKRNKTQQPLHNLPGSKFFYGLEYVSKQETIEKTDNFSLLPPNIIFNDNNTNVIMDFSAIEGNEEFLEELEFFFSNKLSKNETVTLSKAEYLDETKESTLRDLGGTYTFTSFDKNEKIAFLTYSSINNISTIHNVYNNTHFLNSKLIFTNPNTTTITKKTNKIVNFLGGNSNNSFESTFGEIHQNDIIELKAPNSSIPNVFTVISYKVTSDGIEEIEVVEDVSDTSILGEAIYVTVSRRMKKSSMETYNSSEVESIPSAESRNISRTELASREEERFTGICIIENNCYSNESTHTCEEKNGKWISDKNCNDYKVNPEVTLPGTDPRNPLDPNAPYLPNVPLSERDPITGRPLYVKNIETAEEYINSLSRTSPVPVPPISGEPSDIVEVSTQVTQKDLEKMWHTKGRKTWEVRVESTDGSNVFNINGQNQPVLVLDAGDVIRINQRHSSNSSIGFTNKDHPIAFSSEHDGTHYYHNSSEIGTRLPKTESVGTSRSFFYWQVPENYNEEFIYYYCTNHPNMGGEIIVSNYQNQRSSRGEIGPVVAPWDEEMERCWVITCPFPNLDVDNPEGENLCKQCVKDKRKQCYNACKENFGSGNALAQECNANCRCSGAQGNFLCKSNCRKDPSGPGVDPSKPWYGSKECKDLVSRCSKFFDCNKEDPDDIPDDQRIYCANCFGKRTLSGSRTTTRSMVVPEPPDYSYPTPLTLQMIIGQPHLDWFLWFYAYFSNPANSDPQNPQIPDWSGYPLPVEQAWNIMKDIVHYNWNQNGLNMILSSWGQDVYPTQSDIPSEFNLVVMSREEINSPTISGAAEQPRTPTSSMSPPTPSPQSPTPTTPSTPSTPRTSGSTSPRTSGGGGGMGGY